MKVIRMLNYFILLILLSGCAQVFFTSPQPTRGVTIKSFVGEMHGTYSDSALNLTIEEKAVWVESDRFELVTKTPAEGEVLVKYYKGYYFASFPEGEYFMVYMASYFDNKIALYMLNADDYSIEMLNRFTAVESIGAESDSYLVSPSRREFDNIIESELFDVIGILEKQ